MTKSSVPANESTAQVALENDQFSRQRLKNINEHFD